MSGKHPLVGRVLVNRIWLHHFGRGLVATPADFGRMGERPTNPELLDWLADEFATSGWNLKRLQRLIVTSTAYRQSSARTPERDAADPDNLLLSRMNVRRLDAEVVRDCVLAASGSLFDRMSGRPVPVREDAVGQIVVGVDTKVGANEPGAEVPIGAEEFRRSVYIEVRRSRPLALLRTFDLPVMETNCDRRVASTSAPAGVDADEQRVRPLAGEPVRPAAPARRRDRSATASRPGVRDRLRATGDASRDRRIGRVPRARREPKELPQSSPAPQLGTPKHHPAPARTRLAAAHRFLPGPD